MRVLIAFDGSPRADAALDDLPRAGLPEALAALGGAAVVVIGSDLRAPSVAATIAGAFLCFSLRFMPIRHGWLLPVARDPEQSATAARDAQDQKEVGVRRF